MPSVREIRERLRSERIDTMQQAIAPLLAGRSRVEVWLFGSLARGDWDAHSKVDLLGTGLAVDVIALRQANSCSGSKQ
jgi:predicted nucleotidyltransferase